MKKRKDRNRWLKESQKRRPSLLKAKYTHNKPFYMSADTPGTIRTKKGKTKTVAETKD